MPNAKKKPAVVAGKGATGGFFASSTNLETPPRSSAYSSSSSRGGGRGGAVQSSATTSSLEQPSPAETASTCSSSGAEEEEETCGKRRHRGRRRRAEDSEAETKKMGQQHSASRMKDGARCSDTGSRTGGGSGGGKLPPLFPRIENGDGCINADDDGRRLASSSRVGGVGELRGGSKASSGDFDSTASVLAGSTGGGESVGEDSSCSSRQHAATLTPVTPEGDAPTGELFPSSTPVRGKKKISPAASSSDDAADCPATPSRDVGHLLKSSREDLDDMGTQLQLMEDDLSKWNEQFDSLLTSFTEHKDREDGDDDDTKSGTGASADTSEDVLVAGAKERRRAEEARDAVKDERGKSPGGSPRALCLSDCGSRGSVSFGDSAACDSSSGVEGISSSMYGGSSAASASEAESRREERQSRNNRNLRRKVRKRDRAIEELKASQAVLLERIVAVRTHSNKSRKNCSKLSRAFQGVIRKLVAKEEERFREMARKLAKRERENGKKDRRIEELERELAEVINERAHDSTGSSACAFPSSPPPLARRDAGNTSILCVPSSGREGEQRDKFSQNGMEEDLDQTKVGALMSEQAQRRHSGEGEGGCASAAEAALHRSYGAFIADLQATYEAENRELRVQLGRKEYKEEKVDSPQVSPAGRKVVHSLARGHALLAVSSGENEPFVCDPDDSTKLAKLASEVNDKE